MFKFNFDFADFMVNNWQKRPVVIRQGFSDFIDPISADELAGLAMEAEIDARMVIKHQDKWTVAHGPFSSFDELDDAEGSLLVQAVNHWHEAAAQLMHPFHLLPGWRLEDLMVSFSTPGGGVGPHRDQYDVFIIQGMGKRRWRVGEPAALQERTPHPDLLLVEDFTAILDEELLPGDILYIPPGFPHEGYSVETSLNYSVGCRAPNQRDLFASLADFITDHSLAEERYTDPDLRVEMSHGVIADDSLVKIKSLMADLLQDETMLRQWFGEYISQGRHDLDLAPAEPPWTDQELALALHQGKRFLRLGGLRAFYHQHEPHIIYVDGVRHVLPEQCVAAAQALCDEVAFDIDWLGEYGMRCDLISLLVSLVNQGYWYPAQE